MLFFFFFFFLRMDVGIILVGLNFTVCSIELKVEHNYHPTLDFIYKNYVGRTHTLESFPYCAADRAMP